ncbi:MAG: hypothetical protein NTV54_15410 [Ignavibacteriales bacterium]|nr:hypothetical protein [Ignavibacteriales bacterium]
MATFQMTAGIVRAAFERVPLNMSSVAWSPKEMIMYKDTALTYNVQEHSTCDYLIFAQAAGAACTRSHCGNGVVDQKSGFLIKYSVKSGQIARALTPRRPNRIFDRLAQDCCDIQVPQKT